MSKLPPRKAHFVLDPALAKKAAGAGGMRTLIEEVVERVAQDLGESPTELRVMSHAGALSVAASPRFLRALANQPEVARRISPAAEPSLIAPVSKKKVSLDKATGLRPYTPRKR